MDPIKHIGVDKEAPNIYYLCWHEETLFIMSQLTRRHPNYDILYTNKVPYFLYHSWWEGPYSWNHRWHKMTLSIISKLTRRDSIYDILADIKGPYWSYHNKQGGTLFMISYEAKRYPIFYIRVDGRDPNYDIF